MKTIVYIGTRLDGFIARADGDLDWLTQFANDEAVQKIGHGMALNLPDYSDAKLVRVFRGQSELIAICARVAGTLFQPKVVLLTSPATASVQN